MVTVQIATRRAGVPHARNFARWANAAFAGAATRRLPTAAELTIRVVGAAESRKLNRTWRGKDRPKSHARSVRDQHDRDPSASAHHDVVLMTLNE